MQKASSPVTCHALRLVPGDELLTSLLKYVKENGLKSAFVMTCCGSVTKGTLRYANDGAENKIESFEQQMEILSLVGTLSSDGGHHLHISLGDLKGKVLGGHVIGDLIIFTTAEIVLGELPEVCFTREVDPRTGWDELMVKKI